MRAPDTLTIDQIAAGLGVNRSTVANWRSRGKLPSPANPGGRPLRYRESDIVEWIRGCEAAYWMSVEARDDKTAALAAAATLDQQERLAAEERVVDLIEAGKTREQVAAELGMSTSRVRKIAQRWRVGSPVTGRRPRWDYDAVVSAVVAASADISPSPLTHVAWERWRLTHDGPSDTAVRRIMGMGVIGLAEEMGLPTLGASRSITSTATYTDDDLIEFLRACPDTRVTGYDAWRRTHRPDAPGVRTIIDRFGSWASAQLLRGAPRPPDAQMPPPR